MSRSIIHPRVCLKKHRQVYVLDFYENEETIDKAAYQLFELDKEETFYYTNKETKKEEYSIRIVRSEYSLLIRQCTECNICGVSIVRRWYDSKYNIFRIKYMTKMLFFDIKEREAFTASIWEIDMDLESVKDRLRRFNVDVRF